MKLAKMLWKSNISAEYSHLDNPKFKRQLDEALERRIPFMVVFGDDEISNNLVKIKNMTTHEEVAVDFASIVSSLVAQGCSTVQAMENLSI
jgi:histidyl-tRNA synthetase